MTRTRTQMVVIHAVFFLTIAPALRAQVVQGAPPKTSWHEWRSPGANPFERDCDDRAALVTLADRGDFERRLIEAGFSPQDAGALRSILRGAIESDPSIADATLPEGKELRRMVFGSGFWEYVRVAIPGGAPAWRVELPSRKIVWFPKACCNAAEDMELVQTPGVTTVRVPREGGDVILNVNVNQEVNLPPPPPPPPVSAPTPEPEPKRNPQPWKFGLTGGLMLGDFSSRPVNATLESITGRLLCIDGRMFDIGIALGEPGASFTRIAFFRTSVGDGSYTRYDTRGTVVTAFAEEVRFTGFRAERVFRLKRSWPVTPAISASFGAGSVSGGVYRRFEGSSGITADRAEAEKLLGSRWIITPGAGLGFAGELGRNVTFTALLAGFEYPGVYWRGNVNLVYWPGR